MKYMKAIKINRFYPYAIEKVWAAITDADALSEWLMPTEDFVLKKDHQFKFKTKPSPGFDGIVHCKIIDIHVPNQITYHWQGGNMKQPTTVLWKLKQIEDGTVVELQHTGFEGLNGLIVRTILSFGWKSLLGKKLSAFLNKDI